MGTKIKIPITGTVTGFDPACARLDNIGISGDSNDPVGLIRINLGNISWRLISIDLESDMAEIEIEPGTRVRVLKDGGDPENPDDWTQRPTTPQEKQQFINNAVAMIESKTKDELYALSGSKRLIKQQKHVDAYKKLKKGGE